MTTSRTLFLCIVCCLAKSTPGWCDDLILAEGGKSSYHIAVALDASVQDYHAAQVLQRYVKEMTGAELRIVSDDNALADHEIIVGFNRHVDLLDPRLRREAFGPEEFLIRTYGKRVVIVGGSPRGVLYGVNSLLTDEFGCRWFTPLLRRIPKSQRLVLAPTDRRYEPPFEWRDAFFWSGIDNEWSFHNFQNKLYVQPPLGPQQGGRGGFAVRQHTALYLIQPDLYQKEHPEYFWTGKDAQTRTGGFTGLGICLNHPDVAQIAAQRLREVRRTAPAGDLYYCLSAMDYPSWCECDYCKAFHKQEAGGVLPDASVTWNHGADWFNFATKVQALVLQEPNPPKISVMAYGFTPNPPAKPVMHKDMHVFYAEITACTFHRLDDPDNDWNKTFRRRLEGWLKCAGSVYVWLYKVNFSGRDGWNAGWSYINPNMHTFADDFRYLRKMGVKGVFAQGNQQAIWGKRFAGEMNELRAYLLARLLWNPDLDWRQDRREFCAAYYGPEAGAVIEQYLDDVRDEFVKHDVQGPASLMDSKTFAWITPQMFARWHAYMDKAEALAADKDHKKLVQIARLPITLTEANWQKDPEKRKAMFQVYFDTAATLGAAQVIREGTHYIEWQKMEGLKPWPRADGTRPGKID